MAKEQHINFPGHTPMMALSDLAPLIWALRQLISEARSRALRAVDVIQVQTCWQVGRHILGGEAGAAYGYKDIPICDALRHKLSWTHYRLQARPVHGGSWSNLYQQAVRASSIICRANNTTRAYE